jgi:hypothetical protein
MYVIYYVHESKNKITQNDMIFKRSDENKDYSTPAFLPLYFFSKQENYDLKF